MSDNPWATTKELIAARRRAMRRHAWNLVAPDFSESLRRRRGLEGDWEALASDGEKIRLDWLKAIEEVMSEHAGAAAGDLAEGEVQLLQAEGSLQGRRRDWRPEEDEEA